jgi:uncharacterized protein DUF5995
MPDGRSRKPDHDRFNILLERSYDRVIRGIRERYDPTIESTNPSGNPADDKAGETLVAGWREQVWRNAERLLNATTDEERRQVETSIEENAANSARGITSNPDPQGHRAFRDAYCRQRLRKTGYRTKQLLAIRLTARPRRVRAGGRRRVRFLATTTSRGRDARRPVNGALVRFAGGRARTGADGTVTMRVRLRRAGRRRAQATFGGLRAGSTRIRVVPGRAAG